jgi:shikimate dehydrogenase
MLVAQAIYAEELFCGLDHDKGLIDRIYQELLLNSRNIVLSGMSMAGKTTVGQLLSEKLGKKLVDTDQEIIAREKRTINEIFATDGETYFRDIESIVTKDLGKENGLIIALGGGAILREENVEALKRNGIIFFLDRPLEQILPTDDRPLANTADKVRNLYNYRYPIYNAVCDIRVINDGSPEQAAEQVAILATQN